MVLARRFCEIRSVVEPDVGRQTGAHSPADSWMPVPRSGSGTRPKGMTEAPPVGTGMTELRHGHDARPLGSRLGNDGGGR